MSIFEGDAPEEDKGSRPPLGERQLLTVWFFFTLALAVFVLVRSEQQAVSDPVKQAARGDLAPLDDLSLIQPDRFAKALEEIEARLGEGGYLLSLRLDPASANATIRRADFQQRIVVVDGNLEVEDREFSESESKGIRAAQVPPEVPLKILNTIARRMGVTPERQAESLDYFVLSTRTDSENVVTPSWTAYFRGGRPSQRSWHAQFDGSDVYRSGEPDPASVRKQRATERANAIIDRRYETGTDRWISARECVSAASTDVAVRRCVR